MKFCEHIWHLGMVFPFEVFSSPIWLSPQNCLGVRVLYYHLFIDFSITIVYFLLMFLFFITFTLSNFSFLVNLRFLLTEVVVGCPQCYLMYTREHMPANIGVAAQNCYKVNLGSCNIYFYIAKQRNCILCMITLQQSRNLQL